jgi:hypothetical protein
VGVWPGTVNVTVVVLLTRISIRSARAVIVARPGSVPAVRIAVATRVWLSTSADPVIVPNVVSNLTFTNGVTHVTLSPSTHGSHTCAVIVAVAVPSAGSHVGSAVSSTYGCWGGEG